MPSLFNILVIFDGKSGLAEIMAGYLNYYGDRKLKASVKSNSKVLHPLAEQVMTEDGIEVSEFFSPQANTASDLIITINSAETEISKTGKNFIFNDPLLFTSYNEVIDAYRSVREAIKKECIQLVGEMHLV